MNRILTAKISLYITTCLLALLIGSGKNCSADVGNNGKNEKKYDSLIGALSFGLFNDIGDGLNRAIYTKRILPEDFEKLDFTMPDEKGFGSNRNYEVFNHNSPRTLFTKKNKTKVDTSSYEIDRKTVDQIVTKTGPEFIFNLRRQVDEKSKAWDRLFLIIANVKEEACLVLPQPIRHLENNIQIPPDNHKIVFDKEFFEGCVLTPDGKINLFINFASRHSIARE